MRANAIAHGQQEDLERDLLERALDDGGVGDNKELLNAQSTLGYAQLRQANLKMQQEVETLQQLNNLKREMDNDNVKQIIKFRVMYACAQSYLRNTCSI